MSAPSRDELRARIDAVVAELGEQLQPHDVAYLRELALEAEDAETAAERAVVAREVEQLRAFCLRRTRSAEHRLDLGRHRP